MPGETPASRTPSVVDAHQRGARDPSGARTADGAVVLRQRLGRPLDEALWQEVAVLAEDLGGGWQSDPEPEAGPRRGGSGGLLGLPVTAGLRHGWVEGRLIAEGRGAETELVFTPQKEIYRLHRPSVAILLFSALAGSSLFAWPFFPAAASLLPFSLVLLIGAWFLVISRLTHRGVKEFLETISSAGDSGDGGTEIEGQWPAPPGGATSGPSDLAVDEVPTPLRPS